ncbi:MAG: fatty acid desaturase family protein [Hoeflea sp.]|uniref:fatty acid desaturase family protein n=1 Tax=Hoeflea sp. TaxID=1940281 RepID=UPI001DFE5A23|nr:fatty acid desaturase family protein [Hoeflea sp.]MBU4528078.1 fatty acid desaturase family protein [Alphaproteobacteria bacterium]MBU4543675.1 fatty acid desaturase family protein [Alphaproteobacteria bacterium]MBU4548541.1 fatty acid desaturase family protein [Alphaproteobacteria bacterium]MBV1725708.1 fatty acid desaturase family protein [Hoeflea sp.]MBV1762064.1 fatty acid desaturase family protein [Hoeflea sp.]
MSQGKRDYSLTGRDAQMAVETGLASAEWYHTDVPRKAMKELMKRKDGPAIRDTVIWLGSMIVLAGVGVALWPSWWSAPFFLAYGVLYGSATDSRWHECGHGTAFKTRWMNDVVYQIASFMIMRNPVTWRWSHTRHHTDTIIVGRDPEIVFMRPPDLAPIFLNFFGVIDAFNAMSAMVRNALGIISAEEKTFVPDSEQPKVMFIARVWLAIYATVIALAISTGSILPLMLVGLPRLYGAWHHVMTGLLQHGGLAENVIDHRLNSRTVYMNPISRFIYWNMNYHVEHHMFPMIPYHALPKLHALIKDDLPAPNTSILDGYREMWPAVLRQLRYEDYFVRRELPPTAKPYKAEYHQLAPSMLAAE